MRKNVASQIVAFQMNSATDGSAVTSGTPTVYVTIDGGTQATGTGTSTHEGNGQWSYAPVQAETNGNHVAFTMAISGAISQTVNVWPVSFDPTAANLGLNNISAADVNAQCDTAISDAALATAAALSTAQADLDTLTGTDGVTLATVQANYAPAKATDIVTAGAITTLSGAVVNVDTVDVCTTNTDMVAAAPTAAAIADAVCDEALSGHVTAGTVGKAISDIEADTNELQTDDVPGLVAALNDISAADVWANGTRTLTTTDGFKKNTAYTNFQFLLVDSSGDPATGITVTAQRSIDGAALANCANAVSELSNGIYNIDLAAADLNGDTITLRFTGTGAQDRLITIITNT